MTTPAPWTPAGSETTLASWVKGPDGKRICTMRESEQDWSNAHLIAAAPDLLAALESLFEHCAMVHKHWGEGCNQREADAAQGAARAAIAKARQGGA